MTARLHRHAPAMLLGCLALSACTKQEMARQVVPPDLIWSLRDDEFWPDPRTYPGVGDGRIVVTNNLSDTLSILDLAQIGSDALAELARVPVGLIPVEREGPHHLTAAPDGQHYYVGISNFVAGAGGGPHGTHGGGDADGYVLKIASADNLEVDRVRVDPNPGDVRLTPDGKSLLVTHYDLNRITRAEQAVREGKTPETIDSRLAIVDPTTMARVAMVPLCPAAHGIAIAPDGLHAYATCRSDELAIVDLVSPTHDVQRVPVLPTPGTATAPSCSPYAATISPSGDSVWVSCFAPMRGEVRRYDVAAAQMDEGATIVLPGPAVFGGFTADGKTLYVPHQQPDGLAIIDATTASLTADVTLPAAACLAPHVVRLSDDETRLLLVCEGNHSDPGTLVVIDRATMTVERWVALGVYPDDLAIVRRP
jgi:DNA-binding beta-propeller fold protein YncE